MTTWTADDIRNYQLPENRDRGPGADYAKFYAFQQAVASVVAQKEARIDQLERQVADPDNRSSVNKAVDLLTTAQETVEQTLREADEYSRSVRTKARSYYEQLRDQAAQIVDQANQEANNIRRQVDSDHGRIDGSTYEALAQQLAVTDTLTTILRGLVDNLESTRTSLDHLRAGGSQYRPAIQRSDPEAPPEATQFVEWPEAASRGSGRA